MQIKYNVANMLSSEGQISGGRDSSVAIEMIILLLAPAVTVGQTEGAMDSAFVFFASSFAYNFVRK